MKSVVIVDALRTPIGSFGGRFKSLTAPELGSVTIGALFKNNSINPDLIDDVIIGNALPAGIGQAPARQAALRAGLKNTTRCTTVNQLDGSGMKAVMYAMQQIAMGDADVVVAGGMESMTNVPYYLPGARFGTKLGHGELQDGILADGLQDAYKKWQMGNAAELCAQTYEISREAQDFHAAASVQRAKNAHSEGAFNEEIVPVKIRDRQGRAEVIARDEEIGRLDTDDIPKRAPAFQENGTVTSANAASISDGAAALLLMSEQKALERDLAPIARLVSQASTAGPPAEFTTEPARAIPRVLERAGKSTNEIDLFEINETFSVSTLACSQLLELDPDTVNIHGGAVSMGNPSGCSGARILVTLLHALHRQKKRWGCAAVGFGGGGAASVVVERFL